MLRSRWTNRGAFYENGALGKKWEGTYLSCEATRNVVSAIIPNPGATYSLTVLILYTAATASDLNNESEEEAEKEFISALLIWILTRWCHLHCGLAR